MKLPKAGPGGPATEAGKKDKEKDGSCRKKKKKKNQLLLGETASQKGKHRRRRGCLTEGKRTPQKNKKLGAGRHQPVKNWAKKKKKDETGCHWEAQVNPGRGKKEMRL